MAKNILILGGDGYLGWPTAMHLTSKGNKVTIVDNYLKRILSEQTNSKPLFSVPSLSERCNLFHELSGTKIASEILELRNFENMLSIFERVRPDCVIHYAEQPSAPYSMRGFEEANLTLKNNLEVTMNVLWATKQVVPECHIIKLGTMGEYGTPNIDIEEGWIEINHKGRSDVFLYPRAASSLYHTTKVLDTDLIWFYVRTWGLKVTDLMQGPVYGFLTPETSLDSGLYPHFYYDDIFGTVLNRFLVQAVCGLPLTVYGKGGQTRGYLNLLDTLQCIALSVESPPNGGELRVINQFTQLFSVNDLANLVQEAGNVVGLNVTIKNLKNPRKEKENHYYNPTSTALPKLGLKPNLLNIKALTAMLQEILLYKNQIDQAVVSPRVSWSD